MGFLRNVGSSALEAGGNVVRAATENIPEVPNTLRAIARDPKHAIGGIVGQGVESAKHYITDRYYTPGEDLATTESRVLGTLYHDPVGAALDASVVAGGVEGAAGKLGLSRTARLAGTVREVVNPMSLPIKAAAQFAQPVYESAFGPAATARLAQRKPGAMNRAFKAGYTSERQVQARLKEIDGLQDAAVARASASTPPPTVNTSAPLQHPEYTALQKKYQHFPDESTQVENAAEPLLSAPSDVPLQEGNTIRKVYNERTASAFEKGRPPQPKATMQSNLALRQAVTEEVYKAVPELKLLNAEDSDLISFKKTLQQAMSRKPSLFDPYLIGGMAYGAAGGSWRYAVVAGVRDILRYPQVRTRLGVLLRRAGEQSGIPSAVGSRVAAATPPATAPPAPPTPTPHQEWVRNESGQLVPSR
jgi:hypothetical protein